MSNFLQPNVLQHSRLPCPSPTPEICSNSISTESTMPSNHLIFSHPLLLLSSIFPSMRVFYSELFLHIRWPSIGISASVSVLPMNIQCWFPLRLTGLISLQSKGLSGVFSSTTVQIVELISSRPRTPLCLSTGWDFPGGPMVKNSMLSMQRAQVWSWV